MTTLERITKWLLGLSLASLIARFARGDHSVPPHNQLLYVAGASNNNDTVCQDLYSNANDVLVDIGEVCATIVSDHLEITINVTETGCCLRETHVCNMPVFCEFEGCEQVKSYDLEVSNIYNFFCTGNESEAHQVNGHATITCDSEGANDLIHGTSSRRLEEDGEVSKLPSLRRKQEQAEPNFQLDQASRKLLWRATCEVYPDPHFKTWHDTYFDYHGACDLVLINNPSFPSGPFYLHIKTIQPDDVSSPWTDIACVVLRIGSDTFETDTYGSLIVNGVYVDSPPGTINGHPLIVTDSGETKSFYIQLNDGDWHEEQYVRITAWSYIDQFFNPMYRLAVEVAGNSEHFDQSVGLCGTWPTPAFIARDGMELYPEEENAFGDAWWVNSDDPQLFLLPYDRDTECLAGDALPGAPTFSDEQLTNAENICMTSDVDPNKLDNCVFDVLVNNDTMWADAPWYKEKENVETSFNAMYFIDLRCQLS